MASLPTITQKFPPIPLKELTALLAAFPGSAVADKQAIISRLVAAHPICSLEWGQTWRYRRCRRLKTGEVPSTVDELIWRKGVPAALGRANPTGFQVIYLADRLETALSEVRAQNHAVVIAEFSILPGRSVRIAPIGEFEQIQRTGRGYMAGDASDSVTGLLNACDRNEAMSLLITDSFLRECLTNTADDYELSSSVAMAIFDKQPEISAVAYPSRRQFAAINLAVRVERFWDDWGLVSVRRAQASHIAQGYYDLVGTRHVDGITHGGTLKWKDGVDDKATVILGPPWTPNF